MLPMAVYSHNVDLNPHKAPSESPILEFSLFIILGVVDLNSYQKVYVLIAVCEFATCHNKSTILNKTLLKFNDFNILYKIRMQMKMNESVAMLEIRKIRDKNSLRHINMTWAPLKTQRLTDW